MDNLSDLELVNNIKSQREIEFSLQELVDRHSGIFLEMVNSFLKNCNNDYLKQEIINEKEYVIYNSALKYDENRGTKFSTFLGNEAKWVCLNASNKNKKYLELNDQTFDFSSMPVENNSDEERFKEQILESFKNQASQHPDKRVEKIFKMRYANTKKLTPWRKISKEMKLSIQGCINIHNNALNILSKKIRSKYEINSQCTNQ